MTKSECLKLLDTIDNASNDRVLPDVKECLFLVHGPGPCAIASDFKKLLK
jgi:hypothetical protein